MDLNKEEMRNMMYNKLIENHVSTPHYVGRIPDFKGSDKAATNLRSTEEWKNSRTIFTSPDTAQRQVRENVLKDGKTLIMVTPKIENGYLKLKAQDLMGNEMEASSIEGAFRYGEKIDRLPMVDMVVEGSVAVDKTGGRLGKGGGYGDREIEYLKNTGSIQPDTPIVTTVHPLQIVERVPVEKHDQKINMAVTPDELLRIK